MFVLIGVSWHLYVNVHNFFARNMNMTRASTRLLRMVRCLNIIHIYLYFVMIFSKKISRSYNRNIVISNLAGSYGNSQLSRNHLSHCKH